LSRRKLVYTLVALSFAIAAPAFAKGGGGGNASATITFAGSGSAAIAQPSLGSSVGFSVTSNVKPSQQPMLWVTNYCTQNGVTVYAESHGVTNGYSGPFTLSWPGGGAAQCGAYVWLFPNAGSWLGSMSYAASG
jgi:hypothetical protein